MKHKHKDKFGHLVREKRLEKNITQSILAEMIDVDTTTIQRIEAGNSTSLTTARLLAEALKISLDTFAPLTEESPLTQQEKILKLDQARFFRIFGALSQTSLAKKKYKDLILPQIESKEMKISSKEVLNRFEKGFGIKKSFVNDSILANSALARGFIHVAEQTQNGQILLRLAAYIENDLLM